MWNYYRFEVDCVVFSDVCSNVLDGLGCNIWCKVSYSPASSAWRFSCSATSRCCSIKRCCNVRCCGCSSDRRSSTLSCCRTSCCNWLLSSAICVLDGLFKICRFNVWEFIAWESKSCVLLTSEARVDCCNCSHNVCQLCWRRAHLSRLNWWRFCA